MGTGGTGGAELLGKAGGTEPGRRQSQPFKKMNKNPLEIPEGIPS